MHWKKQFNYDYLGAYSLDDYKEIVVTIKETFNDKATSTSGRSEEVFCCSFKELDKPMILNRTNCDAIARVCGSPNIDAWPNTRITLFVQTGVKAFGSVTDALRIRPFAPKPAEKPEIPKSAHQRAAKSFVAEGNLNKVLSKFKIGKESKAAIMAIVDELNAK